MLLLCMIALPIKMVLRWTVQPEVHRRHAGDLLQHLTRSYRLYGPPTKHRARPRPGDGASGRASSNVVFALTSIGLLLVAFSLMIWADYDREWKKYQMQFNAARGQAHREADPAGPRARWTRPERQAAAGGDRPGASRRSAPARATDRQGPGRARQAQRPSGTPSTRTTGSPRPEIDVGSLRLRGGRARGHRATRTRSSRDLERLEDRWRECLLASSRTIGARRTPATSEGGRSSRRRASTPRRSSTELFAENDRLRGHACSKIQPGFVTMRALTCPSLDLANPSLKVNQIMHREPAGRRDLHRPRPRWTAAPPATSASTRRVRERAAALHAPTRTWTCYLHGPHPIEQGGLHRLPPGPRPRHRLRGRRAHPVDDGAGEGLGQVLQHTEHVRALPLLGPAR